MSVLTTMEFLQEPFEILPENRVELFRFNLGNMSPYGYSETPWDYTAKAVRKTDSTDIGIYAFPFMPNLKRDFLLENLNWALRTGLEPRESEKSLIKILQLEADRRKGMRMDPIESEFSEYNIIRVYDLEDYIAEKLPQLQSIIDLYTKARKDPETFADEFYRLSGYERYLNNRWYFLDCLLRDYFEVKSLYYEPGKLPEGKAIEISNRKELVNSKMPELAEIFDLYEKAITDPESYGHIFKAFCEGEMTRMKIEENRFNHKQYRLHGNRNIDLPDGEIQKIRQFAIDNAHPTEFHGLDHWERVEVNGIVLAKKTGASLPVVRAFAYLHDLCRVSDNVDDQHAAGAVSLIRRNPDLLSFLSHDEKNQLFNAIEEHSSVRSSFDATVNTCWDADRLDLTRFEIVPDPYRMASDAGQYYALNPLLFQAEVDSLTVQADN